MPDPEVHSSGGVVINALDAKGIYAEVPVLPPDLVYLKSWSVPDWTVSVLRGMNSMAVYCPRRCKLRTEGQQPSEPLPGQAFG